VRPTMLSVKIHWADGRETGWHTSNRWEFGQAIWWLEQNTPEKVSFYFYEPSDHPPRAFDPPDAMSQVALDRFAELEADGWTFTWHEQAADRAGIPITTYQVDASSEQNGTTVLFIGRNYSRIAAAHHVLHSIAAGQNVDLDDVKMAEDEDRPE
jgi:hypothetical protein